MAAEMTYRNLGRAGVKVSELSFGSWLTFGDDLDVAKARTLMRLAYDHGVNFFDNAEVYGQGRSEEIMGEVVKDFRREDLVISTKIFWGGKGPNDVGVSWKRLVEGTRASLKRMQLEYVDLLFCHRPDLTTPVEETVRAMDYLIRSGHAFYWGTSEWPAERIEQAIQFAERTNCIPPVMEQPQYNILVRERFEREYAPLFERYGYGTTIWSPLASGVLTGKYLNGLPDSSRLAKNSWLRERFTPEVMEKVRHLEAVARGIDASLAQLSIAWCLQNSNVSTVILGATSEQQLRENLAALEVRSRLTADVLSAIDSIVAPGTTVI